MIGAIVLTHRKRGGVRPQNIAKQNARQPHEAIRNINQPIGQGWNCDDRSRPLSGRCSDPVHHGVLGIFLNRKNLIVILMAIELILLAVNLNLVAFSAALQDLVGQVFAMFVLTVAAGESAIGLAILVIYFRGRGTIAVDDVNRMKG